MNNNQYTTFKRKKPAIFKLTGWWLMMFTLLGCSVNKYLQPGEVFYNGATVKINQDTVKVTKSKILAKELKTLLRPTPNSKILGRRQKVWYYFAAGEPKKDKGLRHWMKYKLGQPPVFMSDVDPERNVRILENNLENNGYFFAKAKSDTVWGKYQGKATYTVTQGYRYSINEIFFSSDSSGKAQRLINLPSSAGSRC